MDIVIETVQELRFGIAVEEIVLTQYRLAKEIVVETMVTGFIGDHHIQEDAEIAGQFIDYVTNMEDILKVINAETKAHVLPAK